MNTATPQRQPLRSNADALAQAVQHKPGRDALPLKLTPMQWELLASYMQPLSLEQGQMLIEKGTSNRTLYLVETGSLTVHYQDSKSRVRLALVGAGSAVGEGSFFSHEPRRATVQAAAAVTLWSLAPTRFAELSSRHPEVALALAMALASLLSRRAVHRSLRPALT